MTVHLTLRRSLQRSGRSGPVHLPRAHDSGRESVAQALGAGTLAPPVQAKLTLGAVGDAHEQEADAMAERVMRMPLTETPTATGEAVQRQCSSCEQEEPIQRKCADCEEEDKVQRATTPAQEEEEKQQDKEKKPDEAIARKHDTAAGPTTGSSDAGGAGGGLPASTAARIQQRRGSGSGLPASERGFFEPRFGQRFDGVKVHADGEAAQLSQSLGARAFTVGRDVFFGAGEYRPGTSHGRHLLAHELTHVLQQQGGQGGTIRRWNVGPAPAPHGWNVITDAEHLRRLGQAEAIVRGVIGSRNCRSFFEDNCTNGQGANALQDAFDNANVYLRPGDDNVFGEGEFGGHNIAFNERAFRIGRFMMASSLLHEMFHNCDTTGAGTGRAAELGAENSVEACRLHTPWIDTVSPRTGTGGDQVTIRGWGFGPVQGGSDGVTIGGVNATIVSWAFMAGTSSRVEIVAEVPAGAGAGGVVVTNNGVRSNAARFTAT
ncbi:eCIS core domain-containing protein [Chitinimonas naiadis]